MNDIAKAAGVSRPALYVVFNNKEDIFTGVYWQWVDRTLAEIEREIVAIATPQGKIQRAFEIWSVRPFEMVIKSPEARELLECGFEFAHASLTRGYLKFEATITPVLASIAGKRSPKASWLQEGLRTSLPAPSAGSNRRPQALPSYGNSSKSF